MQISGETLRLLIDPTMADKFACSEPSAKSGSSRDKYVCTTHLTRQRCFELLRMATLKSEKSLKTVTEMVDGDNGAHFQSLSSKAFVLSHLIVHMYEK